ncbi:conserved hypothetical protein YCF52 [Synechococcus elongatus PCC 7942 = FACHB-805]|uniref:N-acetyltransferase domain-containing protein n=2 Tax=Synechococcus elongatus TaxID=32046 RepID=Q31Q64_SYNE7|nr:conserved hypothetical protein YCF52 [Synechococcus elongatus PCC 7942 = FACHB-805]
MSLQDILTTGTAPKRVAAGMGFWKSLFSALDTPVAAPSSVPADDPLAGYGPQAVEITPAIAANQRLILSTRRDIDLQELEALCDAVGWSRRPVRKVRRALDNSFLVVSLWEQLAQQRRLIGFARATSDHAFNATIWDVVINPSFQGQGLGRVLMEYVIAQLQQAEIPNITLFADPHVVDFYRRLGFVLDPEGIKGMFWYPS